MKLYIMALLAFSYSIYVNAANSHCTIQEQIIFSCSLGNKIVSVCASLDLTPTSGYVHYRFGLKNAPELILPTSDSTARHTNIRAKTLMFSGGGGGYLRFINSPYNYIVYTAIGKGWGTKDGVAVEKNGKLFKNIKCQEIPISQIGEDFFRIAGLVDDQIEFLLP